MASTSGITVPIGARNAPTTVKRVHVLDHGTLSLDRSIMLYGVDIASIDNQHRPAEWLTIPSYSVLIELMSSESSSTPGRVLIRRSGGTPPPADRGTQCHRRLLSAQSTGTAQASAEGHRHRRRVSYAHGPYWLPGALPARAGDRSAKRVPQRARALCASGRQRRLLQGGHPSLDRCWSEVVGR